MRRELRGLVVGTLLLTGCGGHSISAIGFINQTRHSDAALWSLWKAAQQSLSQQIDLNPVQRTLTNVPPDTLPGDVRVWNISPRQLVVSSQPDVSSSVRYAATGASRQDPTGLISCPAPCNVNYAPAYSLYVRPASRYAASWEFSGNNFDVLVEYEFENQILNALGYDMRWR
jgi:hypothetical protein